MKDKLKSGTATEEEILSKLDALFEMYANLHDEIKSVQFVTNQIEMFAERLSYIHP